MDNESLLKKGEKLFLNGQQKKAEKIFNYLLNINPNNAKSLNNLGVIFFSRGDFIAAEEKFKSAMAAKEGYPDPFLNIANLYIKMGDWEKAINVLTEFTKHHPSENINQLIHQLKEHNIPSVIQEQPNSEGQQRKTINQTLPASRPAITHRSDLKKTLRILFVQEAPCIRNYKMASALRSLGHDVSLAYQKARISQMYKNLKDEIYTDNIRLRNYRHLWDISKNYDIIHCHNEPDLLSVAALAGDAPVIHDTHDLVSLRANENYNLAYFEGIANRGASGRIYTTPYQMEEAKKLYGVQGPSLVFYNYASKPDLPLKFYPKLSDQDGTLHIVYEGGIGGNAHRDFKALFTDIANKGIHIHIYPTFYDAATAQFFNNYPLIHYYKPLSPKEIMTEMTQYDFGIIPFNLEKGNRRFLDSTIANKLFEYLSSGLPVLASNLKSYRDFFNRYPVGITFEKTQEIFDNIENLIKIKNNTDFSKYVFTFEDEIDDIVNFYREIVTNQNNKISLKNYFNQEVNKEKKSSFYNVLYSNGGYLKQYHKHYTNRLDYNLWKQSLLWIQDISNPKIIEIACGCGQFANMLFDNNIKSYIGIDFSDIAIKMAKENNPENANLFYHSNIFEFDLKVRVYNVIVIFEALEHMERDLDLLALIEKDVTLIFSLPNFPSESHVRYFKSRKDITNRYGSVIKIEKIQEFPIGSNNNIYLIKGKTN